MAKRIGIIVFLLCFCIYLMPYNAYAALTTDAKEPIVTDKECSLTVNYSCEREVFSQLDVKLYKVAQVTADYQYTLTSSFADTNLSLNGISASDEWNAIRSSLESFIIAEGIAADFTAYTDESGRAIFESLKPGLYLAITDNVIKDETIYIFDSSLVALPCLAEGGVWQYSAEVNAKSQMIPPVEADEETQLRILKLWKGDSATKDRPESVEIEIFRNGTSYQTVTLSNENNWTHNWTVKNDGSEWMVAEKNKPPEYTVTIERRENTFVVTNTRIGAITESPSAPQTGESHNVMLYGIVMILCGSLLIAVGYAGKRKRV